MKVIIHEIREDDAQILVSYEKDHHKEKVLLDLGEWIKISYIKTGEAEITIDEENPQLVTFVKHIGPFKKDGKKSGGEKSDKDWTDEIVDLKQLLNDAHTKFKGKFGILTEKIFVDFEKKQAIFKASVIVENLEQPHKDQPANKLIFEGHGDATQENITNKNIQPHFIRMAETRAIVRALRWATNNAKAAEEEKTGKIKK